MNYNYVIDSSFQPFSMQEMLVPLAAYKDAYEKDEERYLELQNKAGDLAAVINTLPEESAVRKQYENYYNELNKRAKEFSNNGKSFSTGKALLDLRRRYQGEIGSIEKANNALNEELKLRRTIMAQDPTMLYNMENPTLENYMPGAKRNDYSISGNYLSAEGAKMGEALSKRIFTTEEGKNNILGGYYIDYCNRIGIKNADIPSFMQSPEFAKAMQEDLMSKGVYDNLSGNNLQRAIDAYRSGAMKGFVYSEQHSPQRDLGKPSWSEERADARAAESLALNAASNGMEKINDKWVYNPKNDPAYQKAVAVVQLKKENEGKKPGTEYNTKLKNGVKITWNGKVTTDNKGNQTMTKEELDKGTSSVDISKEDKDRTGEIYSYNELPFFVKDKINKLIGNSNTDFYSYYYRPYKSGRFADDEAVLEIIPTDVVKYNNEEIDHGSLADDEE